MPAADSAERCGIKLSGIRLCIGVMSAATALGVVLSLPGLLFLFGEAERGVPLVPRLIGFAINTVFAGALILFGLRGVRRYRRMLAVALAEGISLEWSADGLAFRSRSRSSFYGWVDVGAICTDRDHMSIGPVATRSVSALLLFDDDVPRTPSLGRRFRLYWAIRRYPLFPSHVDGITIIPLAFVGGADARRLIERTAVLHRRARTSGMPTLREQPVGGT